MSRDTRDSLSHQGRGESLPSLPPYATRHFSLRVSRCRVGRRSLLNEKPSPAVSEALAGPRALPMLASEHSSANGARDLPLADASRRLRRRPGRPRRVLPIAPTGQGNQSAAMEAAETAAPRAVFAASLLPRGLPLTTAASYSGIPVRALWRLISEGKLSPVRVPGCRRVLILREDLDALLETSRAAR
jgi:excisionase family DNA binding protein